MSKTSPERLELPIEGMTCASCAIRIEKRLNTLEIPAGRASRDSPRPRQRISRSLRS